ncbi:MAG: hypothetical protein HY901_13625, partial [Deltaproteobacteria bacterium]|nr:hypothetical protein [Deltaproteobacteria bacterium]
SPAFGLGSALQLIAPLGVGAEFLTNGPVRVGVRAAYDWSFGIGGEVSEEAKHPDAWQAGLTAQAAF